MHTWRPEAKLDTVIGKSHKSQILTLTERNGVYKLAAKTASETAQAIFHVLKNQPKKVVKSITADRGKEFHLWVEVEKGLEISFYFSDLGVPASAEPMKTVTAAFAVPIQKEPTSAG